MTTTERFFIECVKVGLDGQKVAEIPQDIDFRAFYRLCTAHSVTVIVFFAIQDVKDKLPFKLYNALSVSLRRYVKKDIQLGVDSETVIDALERGGVRYMPLKGYYLKALYPKTEMRYASDCDILIDKKEIKKIRRLLLKIGLKIMRYDEHHDILYFDSTKSVFELHKKLFVGKLDKYFGVSFDRAKLKEGYKYWYELSPEDFYLTMVAHTAYHFAQGGGVGVRHLTDLYVYRQKYKLDEEYLAREFEKCGLRDFQIGFEKLEKYFFEKAEADEFTLRLAEYVLSSTVLGNEDKASALEVAAANTKRKAFLRVVFPSVNNMKFSYPILNKAIFLLPVFYIVRWFRVIFKTPARLSRIKGIKAVTTEEIKEVKEIRVGLGINNL